MRHLHLAEKPDRNRAEVSRAPLIAPLAPVHKVAMGIAVGIASGTGLFALTAFHVVLRPPDALAIELLAHYFNGYEVSWKGAAIGLFWGLLSGFVAGWFVAFVRGR
jgi:hypothetical protein